MDGKLHPDAEQQLAASWERRARYYARREQLGDSAFAVAFVAAAALLPALHPPETGVPALVVLAYAAAYAVGASVRFPTGTGFGMPTQVLFIPMLFALPPEIVPLVVAAGSVGAKAVEIARGRASRDRWVVGVGDAWFAIGPAIVFALADPGAPSLADWPVYALAFAVQMASDTAINVLRTWVTIHAPPLAVARELAWVYRTDALLTPVGLGVAVAAHDSALAGLLGLPVVAVLAMFAGERESRIESELELQRAYRGTALLLGDVIEDDDAYTGEHTRGVVELAMAVAEELRLGTREQRACEFGALLHDVGKLRIPNEIINKPGALDPQEWEIIRTHTLEGQRMLERVGGVLAGVGRIVRASHERWDGGGYPDGLRGEQIPLAARIVTACDAYSAMTTDRPYRRALPAEVARAELVSCAGSQFDPVVVGALLRVVERAPESAPASALSA
jgi:HD-GYP domain-containing protein (c-di-GMP phosphodiesterase class II)